MGYSLVGRDGDLARGPLPLIAGRIIWHAADTTRGRLLAAAGLALPIIFGVLEAPADPAS